MRELVKRVLSPNLRHALRAQFTHVRDRGLADAIRWNRILIDAAVRQQLNRGAYRELDEQGLVAARRSDTVFVFGSGYSLNSITPDEWAAIARHDTFGFTAFI